MRQFRAVLSALATLSVIGAFIALVILTKPVAPSVGPPSAGSIPDTAIRSSSSGPVTNAQIVAVGQIAQARDCVVHVTTYDRVPPTLEQETSAAAVAVIGSVASLDSPRWNTADGNAPNVDRVTANSVYRTMTLSVEAPLKGSPGISIVVRVPGGRAGCEAFVPDGVPVDIRIGDRLAVFVQNLPAVDAKNSRQPTVVDAWPVDPGGTILTPQDGQLPLDTFESSVLRAAGP